MFLQRTESEVNEMKLNDILMAIDQETLIRVAITMYGMKFTTDHYDEYFLD